MQLVGLLNTDKDILKLYNRGFNCLVQDKEFYLFRNTINPYKDFNFSYYNNIHLFIIGNITNIEDIREEKGNSYKENTKILCECIIKSYIKYGEAVFSKLDGSYIIILWDGNKKRLYLHRDIYGTKLLYYYFAPEDGLIFSNNLDILLRITGKKDISHKALHEYLRFLDISPPYTIYENVYFLEPEKILIADQNGIVLKDISSRSIIQNKAISFKDAVFEFKKFLCKSIDARMRNANKVGVFLSGGIDSTLICAIASKGKNNIKTYTIGFEDPLYDESMIAKNVANYLGIEHTVFKFTIEEDFNAFNDFVSIIPSPFADPAAIPTVQCFKHISDNVDIVLDGTGADTLIGIMPARHIRFILKYSRHIPSKLRRLFVFLMNRNKKISFYSDLFDFDEVEELLIRWNGWTKSEISQLCGGDCDLSHTRFYKIFKKNSSKEPYELYSILIGTLPDDRIHQTSAIFDREVVFPFFDQSVQEFVRNLPTKYKYNNGVHKILYKNLLEEFIPRNIWEKPKQGFNYPFENLLKYNDYNLPKTFLSNDAISIHGFFDPLIVEEYLQRFLNSDDTVKFKIWALVVFQAWYLRHYKI